MAVTRVREFVKLVPVVKTSPQRAVWLSYDPGADALYVNFKKPSRATDSELTDDDVILRYEGDALVGFTVLHASRRSGGKARGKVTAVAAKRRLRAASASRRR